MQYPPRSYQVPSARPQAPRAQPHTAPSDSLQAHQSQGRWLASRLQLQNQKSVVIVPLLISDFVQIEISTKASTGHITMRPCLPQQPNKITYTYYIYCNITTRILLI